MRKSRTEHDREHHGYLGTYSGAQDLSGCGPAERIALPGDLAVDQSEFDAS